MLLYGPCLLFPREVSWFFMFRSHWLSSCYGVNQVGAAEEGGSGVAVDKIRGPAINYGLLETTNDVQQRHARRDYFCFFERCFSLIFFALLPAFQCTGSILRSSGYSRGPHLLVHCEGVDMNRLMIPRQKNSKFRENGSGPLRRNSIIPVHDSQVREGTIE